MVQSTALPLIRLAEQFASLPGIGMKTAERLAYYVMRMPPERAEAFAAAIKTVHSTLNECPVCRNFTEKTLCTVCADESRDRTTVCVVESPKDIESFERTNEYNGVYHVLHGLLSPMDGIGADDIRLKELIKRLDGSVTEVIMATNPTVEGEATAMYTAKLIKPFGVKVTRLALGLPVGASLEYADTITLFRALQNRNEL
jgi:recombination protein RecR